VIAFKPLLKTNRKIGLVFVHDKGLAVQVRSHSDNKLSWQRFIPFADVESSQTTPHSGIPKAADWILIIPAYQCTTKYAVLPSTDPTEIEKMLEFELPNIVSYNTQPWAWDFSIIAPQENGASKTLIVLSPLSIINSHIKTLSSLGIKPNIVTTAAMFYTSLLSTGENQLKPTPAGCFCFDDDCMDFFVIENRQVTFLRGIRLKKELCKNTRLIEEEIQRSVSILKENESAGYPDRFFAISINNSTASPAKILEKALNSPVEEIELAALYNEHPPITDNLLTVSPDNFSAPAPGKTHINLLPKNIKEKHRRSSERRQMALHALKVCFVLFLAFLSLKTSIWRKNRLLERCEQRLSDISPMAEKLQFLQQQLSIIENQLQGNISMLDIISELYRVLPKDITIHYLTIEQNKKLVIRAQAKLLSQAFDCIGPLEQSGYLENVRQSYANQRQVENSVLIDFEIVADLQKTRR
jgi:hypothetical protein